VTPKPAAAAKKSPAGTTVQRGEFISLGNMPDMTPAHLLYRECCQVSLAVSSARFS
jgi:hypothetical protein